MPFFLVGRSRDDASLTLLSTEVFDTRDLAARAVQSIALTGRIDVDAVDLFIADLDAAAPVVLVSMPTTAPVADEVAAGVWETPEPEPVVVQELDIEFPAPEPTLEEVAAAVESLGTDDTLTAALERATSSMSAGGVVPPESVGFAVLAEDDLTPVAPILGDNEPLSTPVAEKPILETVEIPAPESPQPEVALERDEPEPEPEEPAAEEDVLPPLHEEPEAPAPEAADGTWPWLNVGEVAAAPVVDETVELPSEPASIFEPEPALPEDDSLIISPVAPAEDEFSPKPVIIDDFAEAPGAPTTAYEPSGDLSLAVYTCADCIYSNTCPKVNESTPEECLSFQWKAL